MIILIISVVVIGVLTYIVTRNESREEDERPMNKQYPYRFTADRHDPDGWECYQVSVLGCFTLDLIRLFREEGFCEDRIYRFLCRYAPDNQIFVRADYNRTFLI